MRHMAGEMVSSHLQAPLEPSQVSSSAHLVHLRSEQTLLPHSQRVSPLQASALS